MMGFSVLMSLYKSESSSNLDQCLQSILSQTLQPNEVIIVLDGPIGESLLIILNRWLNLLPIKLIPLENNVGLGNALNIGIEKCSYDSVIRMDTDDVCKFDRFEKLISYLNKNRNVAVVGAYVEEFSGEIDNITGVRIVPTETADIRRFCAFRNPFNHMSVAFRKNIINEVGGYKHHLYMEDYNLWLRVIAKGYEVRNIPESLMYARAGNEMLLRRHGFKYVSSEFELLRIKMSLNIQGGISATFVFLFRALPRILPFYFLKTVYSFIRK